MTRETAAGHQPSLTASALFAGFSFTAALSLLLSGSSGLITSVMAVAFIVSSSAFIISAIAVAILLEGIVFKNTIDEHEDYFTDFGAVALGLGFISFTIGLGTSGFLYAPWLGVISIICAVVLLTSFVKLTMKLSEIS